MPQIDVARADEYEALLAAAVLKVQAETNQLISAIKNGSAPSEDQEQRMQKLLKAMKEIEGHQKGLRQAVDANIQQKEKERAALAKRRKEAQRIEDPKDPGYVHMAELRNMNRAELEEADERARYEEAQKPRGVIPSGGLAGFRVAPDLVKRDYDYLKDKEKPKFWTGNNPKYT